MLTLIAVLLIGQPAYAGSGAFDPLFSLCLASNPPTTPETLWRSWSLAPQVVLPLLLALALYGRGLLVLRASGNVPPRWRVVCATAGWLVLIVALVSPLCRLAATLVSAHMVQHMLLVAVAPSLLVLAGPLPTMNAALPRGWRSAIAAFCTRFSSAWRRPGGPLLAATLYGAAIWAWHAPVIYQAVLLDPALHTLVYAGLIGVSLFFWATVVAAGRDSQSGHGAAILSMLTTMMHTGLLGALLTFAQVPWYPVLTVGAGLWGLSPLTDQQLAGLVMWMPMGAIYLIGSLIAAMAWLAAAARPTPAGP
jgi:putative membrane protein